MQRAMYLEGSSGGQVVMMAGSEAKYRKNSKKKEHP